MFSPRRTGQSGMTKEGGSKGFPFFVNMKSLQLLFLLTLLFMWSCNDASTDEEQSKDFEKGSYGYDAAFLGRHDSIIELSNGESRVLLSAKYQGRVMTSSAAADSGLSFGWLNYKLIESGETKKQFNPVGGEERFWLGPEGGQYSLYFKGKDSFTFDRWQVPPIIDTVRYDVVRSDGKTAVFAKKASITNYSGTTFDLEITRTIRLLDGPAISNLIQTTLPPSVKTVGYESVNELRNAGNDWTKNGGLVSIWLLGMFSPSPQTMVIIPFVPGPNAKSYITTDYFGSIPADRLTITDSAVYFSCDGKYRSKIGIAPQIAKPIAASYDYQNNVLTIVIPQVQKDAPYVNSKWEMQKEPYKGDVINSYNDGPLADGSQMGPFYEIESSSPALELKKGATGKYSQVTIHLQGDYAALREIALKTLHVDLDSVKR